MGRKKTADQPTREPRRDADVLLSWQADELVILAGKIVAAVAKPRTLAKSSACVVAMARAVRAARLALKEIGQ